MALEAPPDQARGHEKLFLLGLLLQAASLYHLDRNRTQRELLGCSWSRPALPYTSESHTGPFDSKAAHDERHSLYAF